MAYKLTQKPTFSTVAKIYTPNEKNGHDLEELKVTFKLVDIEELTRLRDLEPKLIVKDVLVNFADLVDEEGGPVPFNKENLEALLLIPQAVAGLHRAFWEKIIFAKEKN